MAGLVVDRTQRDAQGYVMTPTQTLSTGTYGFVSETVHADLSGPDWGYVLDDLVGDVKVRSVSNEPVFVGIGPADSVSAYLAGVPHEQVGDLGDGRGTVVAGRQRPADPQEQTFWVATTSGPGEQSLRWNVRDGDWRAVVMSADGTRSVGADLTVGAQLPHLLGLSIGLLGGGALLLAIGGAVLVVAVRGSRRAGA
jgi:hypothetical protein